MTVSIIGSGNLGANSAFFMAEKGVADVLLYDIRAGLAVGKALDMMETAPLRQYRSRVRGTDSLDSLEGADIVLLAAGAVRRPGMKREQLLPENRELVEKLAAEVPRLWPAAKFIIATEPVDIMTALFMRAAKLPRTRVLGLGCALDATRLRFLVSRELSLSTENVSAMVIGRHSREMMGLFEYCSVSGVPLAGLLPLARFEQRMEETRHAGDRIVELAKKQSAFYAPAAVAAWLIESIVFDLRRVIPVSLMLAGEYGLAGTALSLPAVVGKEGIVQVLTPTLNRKQEEVLAESAEALKALEGRV